jgi:hypothetical protein
MASKDIIMLVLHQLEKNIYHELNVSENLPILFARKNHYTPYHIFRYS